MATFHGNAPSPPYHRINIFNDPATGGEWRLYAVSTGGGWRTLKLVACDPQRNLKANYWLRSHPKQATRFGSSNDLILLAVQRPELLRQVYNWLKDFYA